MHWGEASSSRLQNAYTVSGKRDNTQYIMEKNKAKRVDKDVDIWGVEGRGMQIFKMQF